MHGELVAIDLETTGLDPLHDAIIEVGAVRLVEGEVVEEFGTLIDPGRPIPPFITNLTGIRADDVMGQPGIQSVLPILRSFVGTAPIIGHNVAFDTSFLYRQGILQNNARVDTYDLAAILLPRAQRYSLANLTDEANITMAQTHRALDDARATALLYWQLWHKLLDLPFETLYEIAQAGRDLAWDTRIVFDAAVQERLARGESLPRQSVDVIELFGRDRADYRTLKRNETGSDLDAGSAARTLEPGGPLAANLPNYEYRPQQVAMTRAVVDAFNHGQHALIEAGTGTGKSIAYLVPSVLWATLNNERVVISTNTINLQDQLMTKDIPTLTDALGIPFDAAVLKGRGNYLCPRRLIATRRRRPTSVDELRTFAKILVWLLESNTGDRGELSLRGPTENLTWQRLSAEDEGCALDRCRAQMEGACPFYKARRKAEAAHLIVVNHALLISDAASDNHVLPDYRYLVVDEGHHLEEATTNGLSFRLDEWTLRRRLADLGGPRRGLLGDVLASARDGATEKDVRRLEQFAAMINDTTTIMEVHITNLFNALRQFALEAAGGKFVDFLTQIRVTDPLRAKLTFGAIQSAWGTLSEFFEGVSDAMHQLTRYLDKLRAYQLDGFDDLVNSAATASRYLGEVHQQLTAFATAPDLNTIYWLTVSQDDNVSLHSAPLHVGPLVDQYLWSARQSVILTSATLSTGGSFDYIKERLHAHDVETVEVGSPFDYRRSTLVYVPTDVPEPNERRQYQQAVERGIVELAAALDGRALVLFTSYTQLRETAQAVAPRLALGNITVYDQSDGSSRQALLDGFMTSERAVLLGTRSFWEGVDIPGDSLSALAIVRLPFAVPNDPVFAARSETYSNSFNEYALPDAILRFRQGFGRLIRTSSDRGIFTVFDSRVVNKSYGALFLESLPDCTVEYGSLQGLGDAARRWLNKP